MSEMGFAADVLNASAADALSVLTQSGNAESLIQAWIQAKNAGAIQEIAECGTGNARTAARRALNILKSRGVAIPAPERRAKLVENEPGPIEAWMLPPDGAGFLMLAIARHRSGGACRAVVITLNDQLGVFRVENVETTPAKLVQSLGQAMPGSGLKAVSIPVEWARDKVARARAAHANAKSPEPMGLTTAKPLIDPVPAAAPEHPFDAEGFEFSEEDAIELAKDSGALHHLPEYRMWLPPQPTLDGLLLSVGKQIAPDGSTPQDTVTELLKEAMLDATDRYFTEQVRTVLAGRMKDAAVSVLERDGEAAALKVAATIQVVASASSVPARDVPFLRAFFEKGVSVLMAQAGGKLNIPVPKLAAPQPEGLSL